MRRACLQPAVMEFERGEHASHAQDRVTAIRRAAAMRGAAVHHDFEPAENPL